MSDKRWQDWATLIAGVWLAAAPWVLGHGEISDLVLYNSLAVGLALVLFSAGALIRPKAWEEVVDFLIALWAMASPWVLGYSTERNLMLNAVVTGLIVAVLAAWTATERGQFIGRKHGPA
jgi:hypothetical protein